MPGLGSKGKAAKNSGARPQRSRNSTPAPVPIASIENGASTSSTGVTTFLELPVGAITVPMNLLYEDILERHGSSTLNVLPDFKHLQTLADDLKTLSSLAGSREATCDKGMRELNERRKARLEWDYEVEAASRDAEEKARLKRVAEVDAEAEKASAGGSRAKRRKELAKAREERPLTHGAHGVARQDGKGDGRHTSLQSFSFVLVLALHFLQVFLYSLLKYLACQSWESLTMRTRSWKGCILIHQGPLEMVCSSTAGYSCPRRRNHHVATGQLGTNMEDPERRSTHRQRACLDLGCCPGSRQWSALINM